MSTRDPIPGAYRGSRNAGFAVARTRTGAGVLRTRRRSVYATPVVTVFGAGITGLSVAHELIERGFRVRVVEKAPSQDREYECEVGGLARNQFARAPLYPAQLADDLPWIADAASARRLHTLFDIAHGVRRPSGPFAALVDDAPAAARTAATAAKLAGGLRAAGARHAFPERLAFAYPSDALDVEPAPTTDLYDAANDEKIGVILARLEEAWSDGRKEIVDTLREMGGDAAVERFDPEGDVEHARLVLDVKLVAYSDARRDETSVYRVTARIAEQARDQLVAANATRPSPIPHLRALLGISGLGAAAANDVAAPTYLRPDAVWVELRALERLLPGEHGYRYFPAFYRNLFDVMRRTPIIDDDGRVTAETAFDQLVPAPTVGFAFRGRSDARGRWKPAVLRQFPRRRALSVKELREQLRLTYDQMGVDERDLLHYEMQLLRYATSSTARRRGYEAVSWWDFLRGRTSPDQPAIRDDDPSDPRNAIYTERMTYWLRELPQALIAMQSSETDARTYGTIVSQLLQGDIGDGSIRDMTLNGPTSVVWLRQWKRFLKRQGVDFYVGELTGLERGARGELLPCVEGPEDDRPRLEPFDRFAGTNPDDWAARRAPGTTHAFDDSDFFVLALPIDAAAEIVRPFGARARTTQAGVRPALEGDLARLANLVEVAGIGDPAGVQRDHQTGRPSSPRYPLRDFAGVQYFFPRRIAIGEGHVFYADAEWGLSSISQLAYWRDRGGPRGAFLGQISVDVGNFYAPRTLAGGERRSAVRCSRDQIARVTWEQVAECLRKDQAGVVRMPAFYHLDEAIESRGGVLHNATPFLISLPRQWKDRPGLYGPAREALGADPAEIDALEDLYPEARSRRAWRHATHDEIRYRVAHQRWVAAGTYMATYTRLTTMEAANESARHAVNAILRALREAAPGDDETSPAYNGAGQDAGDPCTIANPEDNEWPDLEPLRRLDAKLVAEGLPHVLDILRISETVAAVPHRPAPGSGPLHDVGRLVQLVTDSLGGERSPLAGGLDGIAVDLEKKLREIYAKLAG